MRKSEILLLVQMDLGFLSLDETRTTQLNHLIETSIAMMAREGICLSEPFSAEDAQLIVMYSSYLFRKRATNEGLPRMLRWTLNNRIFGKKGGE